MPAFTWIDISTNDYVIDDVIDEIHANINELLVLLERNEVNWDDVTSIEDTQMDLIKDNVEEADYWNYCRNHNASERTTDLDVYNLYKDEEHNYNEKINHDSTHDNNYNVSVDSLKFVDKNKDNFITVDNSDEFLYCVLEYLAVDNNDNTSIEKSEKTDINSVENNSKEFKDNINANNARYRLDKTDNNSSYCQAVEDANYNDCPVYGYVCSTDEVDHNRTQQSAKQNGDYTDIRYTSLDGLGCVDKGIIGCPSELPPCSTLQL